MRVKALARSYSRWAKIDWDIEQFEKTCGISEKNQQDPIHTWQPWIPGTAAWRRLEEDFRVPVSNQDMFL